MKIDKPETISLSQFFKRFPDEETAHLYCEKKRWSSGIICCTNRSRTPGWIYWRTGP